MKKIAQLADFQKGMSVESKVKRSQARAERGSPQPDLVCLSHLRWDFVTQRPQHLLGRAAADRRVFFVEEPIFDPGPARLEISRRDTDVWVVVPHLSEGLQSGVAVEAMLTGLIDRLFAEQTIREHVLWYYTPMALGFTRHLRPLATVYDCMDELSAFRGAPTAMRAREAELFRRADLVFTGGRSLYEAKRDKHPAVYAFPSSIDRAHFAQARRPLTEPQDQTGLPRPRLGFFGVLDERLDAELLDSVASARPDWQLVMIGPVVKIDPAALPRRANIHYLGGRPYAELPAYLAGWDVALMPFAMNESTRFISPTKTPEYLAAGRPVVSTPVRDVVRPYGERGMVEIAGTAEGFVAAVEKLLSTGRRERREWLARVDAFL
ncbi:MAG TPA: glycosyltransferase family 1 protein, partial [Pyrinomonadaceae bacterium]|nr:glycosyltransferase family 1 protein [Pyrinomonadaceae bacterium]